MLQVLPALLCPLMMLVCMGGLFRRGKRGRAGQPPVTHGATTNRGTPRELEIARLRAEQEDLARRIEELAGEPQEVDVPRRAVR